ncbi:alpha/beta-hydrolase [Obba rivulosa]|uniref:Carboxylic ester hydrolase n=1 Tax=Obba rivulosa TaxID=1052685 RepID=A0A8E2DP28_9APHY|nr:alpha/beta-hydrolase [Obba rivulosa]
MTGHMLHVPELLGMEIPSSGCLSSLSEMQLSATQLLAHALLCTGYFLNVFASSVPSGIVDVGYAKYLGNISFPNTAAYLGIPYAEPPLGEQRFRNAAPLNTTRVREETGDAIVNATQYPEFCIQGTTGAGDAGGAGSEDCLKVNIYAPTGAKQGDNLPVLVYIHGGGYVYGNPANWPFDHWVHQSPNVVIVSVYYRLDSFGFLSHPAFQNDSSLGDLNAGFNDQTQALKWIKQYIGAFGGNPSKVTINGQSAGASSVELHLVAKGNEQLFSGAIAQSVFRTPVPSPAVQEPLFNFYAAHVGCESGSLAAQLACLRNASVSALARAQDAASYNFTGAYNAFHPVLDGKILTEFPTISILDGNYHDVPLIVGSTTNETLANGDTITSALKTYFPALTQADLNEFLEQYPAQDFASETLRLQIATGEPSVRCARSIMGKSAAKLSQAFTYRYNTPNPTSNSTLVAHSAENWMMFLGTNTGFNGTTTFTPMTPSEDAFAAELIAYWLSFVQSGNPNTFKLSHSPVWPEYSAGSFNRIVLQEGSATASGSWTEEEPQSESERCEFAASKVEHEQD